MECKYIRNFMHQLIDDPVHYHKYAVVIDIHNNECPACAQYWRELKQLEDALTAFPLEVPPVDFSAINWEQLAEEKLSASEPKAVERHRPRLQVAVIALIAGTLLLMTGLLSLLILPNWLPALSVMITKGFSQVFELVKDAVYWFVLFGTIWKTSVTLIMAHMIGILLIVTLSSFSILYLLRSREFNARSFN